jgi:molybdopterin molybdotransferase
VFSLETAKERLLASISLLPVERAPLLEAVGRFAAESAAALVDLPGFDNSAMDGYAVRSEDLKNASAASPVLLKLMGRIGAGEILSTAVSPGECVRIFTGSALPRGADAVVMQEDVTVEGGSIRFVEPVKPFENIRLRGEDIRAGTAIVESGHRINPATASILAATGHAGVLVRRRAQVALLSTGSELLEAGAERSGGKIYESNRTLLAALLAELHCAPAILPLVPDDLKRTVMAIENAFSANDFVITTGGVSVGEFDFVKDAFVQLGGRIEFWKIAIRPGKPFVFGTLGDKFLFGLPGNPVSAFVTFLILVRPALLKAMGARNVELPRVQAELSEAISNRGDRRHFVRARWEDGRIRVAGPQSSHMISALGRANCLVEVPPQAQLKAGTLVTAQLWELPEAS